MYGLINQAIRDLVKSHHGSDKWVEVCRRAGIADDDFLAMKSYPDALTYGLVGAASEVLGADPNEILRAFGHYWVKFTAEEGYGDLMDLFGRDFVSCLKNLNGMHAHMGVMMPELQPPRFMVEELGSQRFKVLYFSKRAGLGHMVVGLIEGLAEKHDKKIRLSFEPRASSVDPDVYQVEVLA